MLKHLQIRSLAVIDAVELDLEPGFTVLTGETGAGKSVLVDALALALGARADAGAVRSGSPRAEVAATFDVTSLAATAAWLRQHDLDADAECQLRRVVTAEGRSRAYVNGQSVPIETLRDLGSQLVEVCGQHTQQSLSQRARQRDLLDTHGGHLALVAEVAACHQRWAALAGEHEALLGSSRDRDARRDLLRYQVDELRSLALADGEFETLEREQRILANVDRIARSTADALERLYDAEAGSAYGVVATAARDIGDLARLDEVLVPAAESLVQAAIQLRDAAELLRRRLSAVEADPQRLQAVESRLAAVLELARKHRSDPGELWARLAAMERELAEDTASDARLVTLAAETTKAMTALHRAADRLSEARAMAAASLAEAVTRNLQDLGMRGSVFSVELQRQAGDAVAAAGRDLVEFIVSTGPGLPAGPVARVASGGELSRLSLAIHAVTMAAAGAPTLIFDEVDAGIGGRVAEIVGQCLRSLSDERQILCVTHLPQVASQAGQHFAVSKSTSGRSTRTEVRRLGAAERVQEIARMLGGVKITDRTRAHAREMLQASQPRRAG